MLRTISTESLTEDQVVSYYASMLAMSLSDGSLDPEEIATIFRSLDTSDLSEATRARIRMLMVHPPSFDDALDGLRDAPEEVRFGLMMQLTEVALADEFLVDDEHDVLDHAAETLAISADQRAGLVQFVEDVRDIRARLEDEESAAEAVLDAAQSLAPLGIPLAAMYFSGSVLGVSASSVLASLSALGLGAVALPGLGLALLIGAGTAYTAERILRDGQATAGRHARDGREQQGHRLLNNLEESVEHLIDELNLRWEQGRTGEDLERLTERLEALQSALIRERLAR